MLTVLLLAGALVAAWALFARVLGRWHVMGPLAMAIGGAAAGIFITDKVGFGLFLNSNAAERIAELVLALVLFVDATEVRLGAMKAVRGPVLRLLFIALPISMFLAWMFASVLLPDLSLAVTLAIACIIVPVDFSPVTSIVKDTSIPQRLRHILNLESGYNDGIITPLLLFALALAGDAKRGGPGAALGQAIPAFLIAVAVGPVVGVAYAVLANASGRRGWFSAQSMRIGLVAVPLLTYALAVTLHGNGFIAAFVAGTVFRMLRRTRELHEELSLAEDISVINNMVLWFVLGATVIFIGQVLETIWPILLLVALALTVIRMGPVLLSLLGTALPGHERLLIATLCPRGTASVVFGLLAFNAIDDIDSAALVLAVTVFMLGGSVLLHGLGTQPLLRVLVPSAKR
ncbi:cation:proton antiporter [Brevibacterium luteolum]|uniref:Sodium:proton exchanger n=1 Tax=Brevibacterium luteolum TaxID=199591 RepID=A0A849APZ6_9MICO|nr:cation:proton antiporter [Brevibacterium luteolum]MBM7528135.1 NhaP-type Na+/H+ or K+/H+ antiporter [Brevibacterium luteolum]NNG78241.1 sodium:proton exchanger [Brevibacterium luteolum]